MRIPRGPPWPTPKYTAKSWVPYPLVLPWLSFGVAWLALVCFCDHKVLHTGNEYTSVLLELPH
jgi:hypothetical protein